MTLFEILITEVVKRGNYQLVVVGRVGQFSSNTTNILSENLMSCSMTIVEHDLHFHIYTLRMTSSLKSFLSSCFCHPTKCCKAWKLPVCNFTLRMTSSLKSFLSSCFCHPTICCKKKLEFLRLKRKREKGIKKGKFNNLKTMRRYRMYVQCCRWLPF